jgi:hypothetical protein
LGGGVLLLCGLGGVLWGEGGGEVLSVVVRAGAADPQPAGVGQVVRVPVQGQVVNPPVRPSSACVVRGPYWSWWVQEVRYRSSLGEAWGAPPGSVSWQVQPVAGSPGQAVLLLRCPQGGYWQVTVAAQVEYEDPPCSDQWQGTGTATLELMVVSVTFWPQPIIVLHHQHKGMTIMISQSVTIGATESSHWQILSGARAKTRDTAGAACQVQTCAVSRFILSVPVCGVGWGTRRNQILRIRGKVPGKGESKARKRSESKTLSWRDN